MSDDVVSLFPDLPAEFQGLAEDVRVILRGHLEEMYLKGQTSAFEVTTAWLASVGHPELAAAVLLIANEVLKAEAAEMAARRG